MPLGVRHRVSDTKTPCWPVVRVSDTGCQTLGGVRPQDPRGVRPQGGLTPCYDGGMLVLEVVEGPDLGGVFPLPSNEPQLIGRSSEALQLSDPTLSRRHAELTPDNGRWYLQDLASANGTFLNGRLLTDRVPLRMGDEVGCGATLFRFTEHDTLVAPTPDVDRNFDTSAESIVIASPHSLQSAQNHLRMVHRLTTSIAGIIEGTTILRHLVAILVDEFKPDRCVGVLCTTRTQSQTRLKQTVQK